MRNSAKSMFHICRAISRRKFCRSRFCRQISDLQPNPPIQVDPNIETSGLDLSTFGIIIPPSVPRKIYQRGAKSLTWNAEDRNGDRLEYAVYYREANETTFKLLKENLTDNFYTIDGFSLADGRYIFKITASDAISNPNGLALRDEKISEPFRDRQFRADGFGDRSAADHGR